MTANQREALLALNLRQMQAADGGIVHETGVLTEEIAAVCGLGARSTAVILSSCRRRGWVEAIPDYDVTGWLLVAAGVEALESSREAVA